MITAPFPLQVPFVDLKITQRVNSNIFILATLLGNIYYDLAQQHIFIVFVLVKSLAALIEIYTNYVKAECVVWKWVTRTGNKTGPENEEAVVIQGSISCLGRLR